MKHYNIPVFISHFGCPNACVFCNQKKINGRETDVSLEDLKNIPQSLAVAYGDTKVSAILSVLRANLVNHLITDKNTILKVLEEDGDFSFRNILCE